MLRQTRARLLAVAIAALAVGALLVSLTLSLQATARILPQPAPVRYRPIGCVVRGPQVARRNGPQRREVAFGFDDGPGPLTLSFVRMLRAEHAVGTFFMIGEQISAGDGSLLKEELRDGDALGDHTWSHPDLVGSREVAGQLQRTKQAIARVSGYVPCVFRPPYGAYDNTVVRIARGLGLATVTWDVDPRDWALPGTGAIVARVLEQVRPGSIVISHDGGGPRGETLAAYPAIISALRKRGYRIVTVPQLLGFHTIYRACRMLCGEAAVKGPLPPGSIVEDGPTAHTAPRAGPTR
jgi:peptidoglycan-N-acetylglucosamine deacetylase